MGLATDVWNELKKLREHKAFYAAAGAGEATAEALRGLPERFAELQGKVDLAALSGRAVEYVIVAGARAVQTYDELAERGKQVVGRVDSPQTVAGLEYRVSGDAVRATSKNGDAHGRRAFGEDDGASGPSRSASSSQAGVSTPKAAGTTRRAGTASTAGTASKGGTASTGGTPSKGGTANTGGTRPGTAKATGRPGRKPTG